MMEGSRSLPPTNGSGSGSRSGRLKNLRIRIRNSATNTARSWSYLGSKTYGSGSGTLQQGDPDPTLPFLRAFWKKHTFFPKFWWIFG